MAGNDSIADVLKKALEDAQELMRAELALAKAELRDEVRRARLGTAVLAAAATSALYAVGLLLAAASGTTAALFGWSVWTGFAAVGLVLLLAAAALAYAGRNLLAARRRLPRTVETMKENMEWMRARTP